MNLDQYLNFSPFFSEPEGLDDSGRLALRARISALPISLQDLLVDYQTAEIIETVTNRFGFGEEQIRNLVTTIRSVIVADVYIGTLISALENGLKIPREQAREIANTVVDQLFKPALSDIKEVQRQKFGHLMPQAAGGKTPPVKAPGADLPETGGNIINLRDKE